MYRMLFDVVILIFFYTKDFNSNIALKFVVISYDAILSSLQLKFRVIQYIVTFHRNIILELLRFIYLFQYSVLLIYNFSFYYLNNIIRFNLYSKLYLIFLL